MKVKEIRKVGDNITKKGRIKGKNKKETKLLKDACMHHVYKKNGKLKPMAFRNGDYLVCRACGKRITPEIFPMDEIKDRCGQWDEILENGKFIAAATYAGQEAATILREATTVNRYVVKTMKKLNKIASKQDSIKKKKKKQSNNTPYYGSWNTRK